MDESLNQAKNERDQRYAHFEKELEDKLETAKSNCDSKIKALEKERDNNLLQVDRTQRSITTEADALRERFEQAQKGARTYLNRVLLEALLTKPISSQISIEDSIDDNLIALAAWVRSAEEAANSLNSPTDKLAKWRYGMNQFPKAFLRPTIIGLLIGLASAFIMITAANNLRFLELGISQAGIYLFGVLTGATIGASVGSFQGFIGLNLRLIGILVAILLVGIMVLGSISSNIYRNLIHIVPIEVEFSTVQEFFSEKLGEVTRSNAITSGDNQHNSNQTASQPPTKTPTEDGTSTSTLALDAPNNSPIDIGTILFADDFSTTNRDWKLSSIGDKEDVGYKIENGRLTLAINTDQDKMTLWVSPGRSFTDFTMEVDLIYEDGINNHEYGVLFRKIDDDNFYQFAIANGAFSVWKYTDGDWEAPALKDWTESEIINQPGENNHLRIVAVGSNFDFYANDEHLTTLSNNEFTTGDVGLMAAIYDPGQGLVTFDNLVIYDSTLNGSTDEIAEVTQTLAPPPTIPPTPIPTETPRPKPTATTASNPQSVRTSVTCSNEPQGEFRNLWLSHMEWFGCPFENEIRPIKGTFSELPFEKGHLFWIGDVDQYGKLRLAIATFGGQNEGNEGTWQTHPETWNGEGICGVAPPPKGRYLPDRGLAKVWCEIDGINKLGYATAPAEFVPDRGVDAFQNFEKALIFRDSNGFTNRLVYILFRNNNTYIVMRQ